MYFQNELQRTKFNMHEQYERILSNALQIASSEQMNNNSKIKQLKFFADGRTQNNRSSRIKFHKS